MNPELPAPQFNPEQARPTPEVGERLMNPESAGERSPEREQNMQQVDRQVAPAVPVVAVPLPPIVPPIPSVSPPQANDVTAPSLAADDDLIEKEWVDSAKKIISETHDDPYRREQEVNKLQADYLRKRYGRELGVSN